MSSRKTSASINWYKIRPLLYFINKTNDTVPANLWENITSNHNRFLKKVEITESCFENIYTTFCVIRIFYKFFYFELIWIEIRVKWFLKIFFRIFYPCSPHIRYNFWNWLFNRKRIFRVYKISLIQMNNEVFCKCSVYFRIIY